MRFQRPWTQRVAGEARLGKKVADLQVKIIIDKNSEAKVLKRGYEWRGSEHMM